MQQAYSCVSNTPFCLMSFIDPMSAHAQALQGPLIGACPQAFCFSRSKPLQPSSHTMISPQIEEMVGTMVMTFCNLCIGAPFGPHARQ